MFSTLKSEKSKNDVTHLSDLNLLRKMIHLFTGVGALGLIVAYDLSSAQVSVGMAMITVFGLALEWMRFRYPSLNRFILGHTGSIMRQSEGMHITGLTYYALGVCLCFLFFARPLAILSCLCLAIADPLASTMGICFGRRQMVTGKTWVGVSSCMLGSLAILFLASRSSFILHSGLDGPLTLMAAFTGALFCTLGELFSNKLNDNLTIPLITGIGLSLATFF